MIRSPSGRLQRVPIGSIAIGSIAIGSIPAGSVPTQQAPEVGAGMVLPAGRRRIGMGGLTPLPEPEIEILAEAR